MWMFATLRVLRAMKCRNCIWNFPNGRARPTYALRGFHARPLSAGETRRVSFTLTPRDLSMVNDRGERLVATGDYKIFVGGAQPQDAQNGVITQLEIAGEKELPR